MSLGSQSTLRVIICATPKPGCAESSIPDMVETRDEVLRLFLQAVELPAERRSGFLQSHCSDDRIRREVLSLLEYDSEEANIAGTVKGAAVLALAEDNEPP